MAPTPTPPPIPDQVDLAEALVGMGEHVKLLEESARGFKAYMEEQGWSPSAAESSSATWLNSMLMSILD